MVPNTALRWRPSPERLAAAGLDPATATEPPSGPDEGRPVMARCGCSENDRVRPVAVQEVLSDGTRTEITGDGLDAGAQVVVSESYESAAPDTTNPFTTQMFGNTPARRNKASPRMSISSMD